jgi:hypothetical protein
MSDAACSGFGGRGGAAALAVRDLSQQCSLAQALAAAAAAPALPLPCTTSLSTLFSRCSCPYASCSGLGGSSCSAGTALAMHDLLEHLILALQLLDERLLLGALLRQRLLARLQVRD